MGLQQAREFERTPWASAASTASLRRAASAMSANAFDMRSRKAASETRPWSAAQVRWPKTAASTMSSYLIGRALRPAS